jgi:Flp pilus assembly protein TadG
MRSVHPIGGWRRRGLARLLSAREGASAIELGLLLPVFLSLLLGICEFGRALWTQTSLQYAVEDAARCAAINVANCTPDVPTYAANHVMGLTIPSSEFTYTSGASCGITGDTTGAQVSVTHVFNSVVATLIPATSVTLSASSCHP